MSGTRGIVSRLASDSFLRRRTAEPFDVLRFKSRHRAMTPMSKLGWKRYVAVVWHLWKAFHNGILDDATLRIPA